MSASRPPNDPSTGAAWRRAALLMGAAGFGWVAATAGWPPARAYAQTSPAAASRPDRPQAEQDGRLTQAQLEQVLAPIALYPDSLLMQVLMAATYPLEIVQAQRWVRQGQNAQLRGDALAQALVAQPWDPSVKSLLPFADVLKMMNDQLEWTQQIGDALLAQQEDVLNTVQVLRGRAQSAGTLQSGPQQTVIVSQTVPEAKASSASRVVQAPAQTIVIQPTQPDTVYVPVYNPTVAYGSWPYPANPPIYYPPPPAYGLGSALLTGMAFAGGVALVGSLWGWASPGWGGGSVNINANRYNSINVNRNQISGNTWQHDSSHRGGVAYRGDDVRNRYRSSGASGTAARDVSQSREQFRGRMDQVEHGRSLTDRGGPGERGGRADRGGPGDRAGLGERGGPGERGGVADRGPAGNVQRPGASDRPGAGTAQRPAAAQRPATQQAASGRPQVQPQRPSQPNRSPPAFQGSGQGGAERAAAQRGAASRQAPQAPRAAPRGGGGGGARAAGGGRGGGGGRR